MKVSARSILMAGVATATATTVVFAQSVQPAPPPTPAPTVQLVAAVQPLALPPQPPLFTVLLNSPLALLGPAAPFGTLPPAPAPLAIPIAPNLANTIDGIYIAVEPWVRYGVAVAESIVRWIPYVGWFAGQIGVLYEFGESLVASGVFNFTDWLRGDGTFVQNLVDFGIDVGLAFVWLGLDEAAQFFPLPPFCCYPPRPPVQGPFLAAAETLVGPMETAELTMQVDETLEETVATATTEDETVVEKDAEVDAVKEPKEPKDAEATTSSASVAAQGEVRGGSIDKPTESTKVSNGNDKRDDEGTTAKGATESSPASANDDTRTKRDQKADSDSETE